MPGEDVLDLLDVHRSEGLSSAEVERRRAEHGPNELDEEPPVPAWRRLVAQFRDLLILILLAAAVISFVVSGELKTPIVVLVVVVLNAVIGFVQENRAAASLDALRKMLVIEVRTRRDGEWRTVRAEELVPGDIVALEAGDRVPADGRLLTAVQLEIEESALTGESVPATKDTAPVDDPDAGLGDRDGMAFMHTTVTRGRAELVVTATGMRTEIGRIAGMLGSATAEKTPLQRQLDGLAHSLARLAGVIVALVVAIGLLRGQSLTDLMLTAVALAVASIPEGLPAVTAVTLAIGVSQMAQRNAIVKRLASVETLGCTSVICSDKTGTLTLNQMTAVELIVGGERMTVEGTGYGPDGSVHREADGDPAPWFEDVLLPMALCNDATVRPADDGHWELVGDPTEGALVTLAGKGGCDVDEARRDWPRVAEVPFDSAHKLMATFHRPPAHDPRHDDDAVEVRMFVKGAPDALLERARCVAGPGGELLDVAEVEDRVHEHNERLAAGGMRVLAVGWRDIPPDEWREADEGDPMDLVRDITFGALVGIVDPARPEATAAIAEARSAGIEVKMITGDHAVTAASIGSTLGLGREGDVVAVTGRDLDAMSDEELAERIDDIDVFARVSPSHKMRLVTVLQGRGHVVAMTGDGVNDAPALRQADMGIAMGITGTEVTKDAATMVLADDNFATIVEAVRRGRTIYDNIVKFVRFQLSTTLGFATVFLAAAVLGIASGKPFTAIAILWVNVIMDGPPAMALGLDRGDAEIMDRSPRPLDERILTRERWIAVGFAAAIMAVGTLAVLELAPGEDPRAGVASVAGTMGFNTFVLFQFFNILNVRSERLSVFHRQTFRNRWLWTALAGVLALQVAVTHVGVLQRLFDLTSLDLTQWGVCIAVASSVLWAEELRKLVLRARRGDTEADDTAAPPAATLEA
ncbi:HAD-IC family P-type ATPase [Actinomarinicola tropica]|uniref:HAD-IC family P-type ATPase n=2 Tax=Actinomarinicola tropica TaxID=2789776 RepID=A0A5Q2RJH6_9ACTN|nr:HAD-IC family P-type ATPase [Actinomarinicola tropica]